MILENSALRIELDAASGGFRSICDKSRDAEYIGAPDRALLFRAMTPYGRLLCGHVDATQPRVRMDDTQARITSRSGGLCAEIVLSLDDRALTAILRLTNESDLIVEEILFPCIRGLAPVPEAALTWPCFWFRRIENLFGPGGSGLGGDHRSWNDHGQKIVARYPAHLASAWLDYGNAERGLALESRHTDFSIVDFFAHKILEKDFAPDSDQPVRRSLDIAVSHPRRIHPGETWDSPPIRIRVHDGDWHVPAQEHREWLETWIRKPDRPPKFAEAVGWHFFFMKHQDGIVLHTYDDLPRMAQAALDAGCPYLLVFGWQEGGHDNNYMYRYVANPAWGGAEALRAALDKVRALGVEVMPFFNGTLANIKMPEHKRFGWRWEAKSRSGHPYYAGEWVRHNVDAPTRNRSMVHHELAPCREHRAYFLEIVKRIVAEYAFGNLQLDQISEKMFVDYNEDHIETTPDRVYVDGLAELLPHVREIVRAQNPQGVMISEVLNEFTGQWCDSSWDWTALMPCPEPILFTIPWVFASHEIDALEYGEVNKAFAYKLHLDLKIDGGDAPVTKYPKFARHVRGIAELRRRVAPYYVYGDFRDQQGLIVQSEPNVLVKVFDNRAEHKAAVVAAEIEGKSSTARVALDDQWRSARPECRVQTNLGPAVLLPADLRFSLALQPYEVRVLCIDTR